MPSSGQLEHRNIPVKFNEKYLQQLRKSVVLLDQHPILFSTSVYKNIEFGLKVRSITKNKRKQIIEAALDMVDLKSFIHADAKTLSGGETKRVAIARAIACSPGAMLLDEPTADLDLESRLTIENIIRQIHNQKKMTIIFCTHDTPQASRLTDNNIYLLNGQINDIYHENIFKAEMVSLNGKDYYCRIHENILIPIQSNDNDNIKISIHPAKINILNGKKKDPEESFSYEGFVTHLGMQKDKIRAVIDIGIPISLLMEQSEYNLHRFRLKDSVSINFDPDGVTIL